MISRTPDGLASSLKEKQTRTERRPATRTGDASTYLAAIRTIAPPEDKRGEIAFSVGERAWEGWASLPSLLPLDNLTMRGLPRALTSAGLFCLFLLASCAAGNGAAQHWEENLRDDLARYRQTYLGYLAAFNKSVTRALDERRFRRYVSSVRRVEKFSAESHSYTLSLNYFADVYPEEMASVFVEGSDRPVEMSPFQQESSSTPHTNPPSHADSLYSTRLNWASTQNPFQTPLLNDVHSQGPCGACWALAAASAIEAAVKVEALTHGIHPSDVANGIPPLSAQELVDCDRQFNNGCSGGSIGQALVYATTNGLVADSSYRYQGMVSPSPALSLIAVFSQSFRSDLLLHAAEYNLCCAKTEHHSVFHSQCRPSPAARRPRSDLGQGPPPGTGRHRSLRHGRGLSAVHRRHLRPAGVLPGSQPRHASRGLRRRPATRRRLLAGTQ